MENELLALPAAARAVLGLVGGDRVRFLNGMVSNDVARLAPGEARVSGAHRVAAVEGNWLVLAPAPSH